MFPLCIQAAHFLLDFCIQETDILSMSAVLSEHPEIFQFSDQNWMFLFCLNKIRLLLQKKFMKII